FFFQAEDGIRDFHVTGVQTCALPISFAGQSTGGLPHDRQQKKGRRSDYGSFQGDRKSRCFPVCPASRACPWRSCPSRCCLRACRSEERRVGKECRSRWRRMNEEERGV